MASGPARPSSTRRLQLFADKGYFGTSLRDVATAVGVRESALYNYFKSKEALFDALILAHEHTKSERLASLADDGPIVDARALLERLALGSLESFLDPREQMLFRLLMSDGIRLARTGRFNLHERLGSGPERMQELMRRLIGEGWLRKADPSPALDVLCWTVDAVATDARRRRRPDDDPQSASVRASARRTIFPGRRRINTPAHDGDAPRPHARRETIPTPGHCQASTVVSVQGVSPLARLSTLSLIAALALAGCNGTDAGAEQAPADAMAVNVSTIAAVEQPIKRFIKVSGTLTAQEDAEVAAEVAGRVVATPVERGSARRHQRRTDSDRRRRRRSASR